MANYKDIAPAIPEGATPVFPPPTDGPTIARTPTQASHAVAAAVPAASGPPRGGLTSPKG